MILLGIDPGYGRLGIAIIEARGGQDHVLYSRCIETSTALSFEGRLSTIAHELEKILTTWQPQVVGIEKLFFQKNQKTAMRVAETRGMIIGEVAKRGIAILELSPQDIKIALTGSGSAKKEDVARMITMTTTLPSEPSHDDEYDAIACGITASRHYALSTHALRSA